MRLRLRLDLTSSQGASSCPAVAIASSAAGTSTLTASTDGTGEGMSWASLTTVSERGGDGGGPDGKSWGLKLAVSAGTRGVRCLPGQALASGAAGGGAGTAAKAAKERLTNIHPRMAGPDLREARAAAASAAAEVGAAKEAADVGMARRKRSSGSCNAAASAEAAPTWHAEGRKEGVEGKPDLLAEVGKDNGGGRSGRRRRWYGPRRHVRGTPVVAIFYLLKDLQL